MITIILVALGLVCFALLFGSVNFFEKL